jgi:hypothetical protein
MQEQIPGMRIPRWLKVTQSVNDDHEITTYVRWWLPSYWLALTRLLYDKQLRRYNSIPGYRGLRGWYNVLLMDILNSEWNHKVIRSYAAPVEAEG